MESPLGALGPLLAAPFVWWQDRTQKRACFRRMN
jgi:hypothetical protein